MSKKNDSEYDIYVHLENEGGGDVSRSQLAKSLKRQCSYINFEDECSKATLSKKHSLINQPTLERSNSMVVNSNGEPVRISIKFHLQINLFLFSKKILRVLCYVSFKSKQLKYHGFRLKYLIWTKLQIEFYSMALMI